MSLGIVITIVTSPRPQSVAAWLLRGRVWHVSCGGEAALYDLEIDCISSCVGSFLIGS